MGKKTGKKQVNLYLISHLFDLIYILTSLVSLHICLIIIFNNDNEANNFNEYVKFKYTAVFNFLIINLRCFIVDKIKYN